MKILRIEFGFFSAVIHGEMKPINTSKKSSLIFI